MVNYCPVPHFAPQNYKILLTFRKHLLCFSAYIRNDPAYLFIYQPITHFVYFFVTFRKSPPSFTFFHSRAMPLPASLSPAPYSSIPGQCHCPPLSPSCSLFFFSRAMPLPASLSLLLPLLPFQGNAIARPITPKKLYPIVCPCSSPRVILYTS